MSKEWSVEEALASLETDRTVHGDEAETQRAERLFLEALTVSVQSVCHIAMYSPNERLRLDAAKYVIERNLGRIVDATPLAPRSKDPLQDLVNAASGAIPNN
jgi:hypothetical protein